MTLRMKSITQLKMPPREKMLDAACSSMLPGTHNGVSCGYAASGEKCVFRRAGMNGRRPCAGLVSNTNSPVFL